jgi:hypothetical protein
LIDLYVNIVFIGRQRIVIITPELRNIYYSARIGLVAPGYKMGYRSERSAGHVGRLWFR